MSAGNVPIEGVLPKQKTEEAGSGVNESPKTFGLINKTLERFGITISIVNDPKTSELYESMLIEIEKLGSQANPKSILNIIARHAYSLGLKKDDYTRLIQKIKLTNETDARNLLPIRKNEDSTFANLKETLNSYRVSHKRVMEEYVQPLAQLKAVRQMKAMKLRSRRRMRDSESAFLRGTAAYLNFRELSAKEQKRVVKEGALKAGGRALAIYDDAYKWFWDDSAFGKKMHEIRQSSIDLAERKKAEITTQIGEKLDPIKAQAKQFIETQKAEVNKKLAQPVTTKLEEIDAPRRLFVKKAGTRLFDPSYYREKSSRWEKIYQKTGQRQAELFASNGLVRNLTSAEREARVRILNTLRKRRKKGLFGIATNLLMKVMMEPVKIIMKTAGLSAKVSGFATRVNAFLKPRISGLTRGVSKITSSTFGLLKKSVGVTSSTVKAIGNAALPTLSVYLISGGSLPLAIATGITVTGASLTEKLLSSPDILPKSIVSKFGTFDAKAALALKEIPDLSKMSTMEQNIFKLTKAAELKGTHALASMTKSITTASNATAALLVLSFLGFPITPVQALLVGGGSGLAHFGISRLYNQALTNVKTNLMFGTLRQFPGGAVVGMYMGGQWIRFQERRLRQLGLSDYFTQEWLNLRLDGGLGNIMSGASFGLSTYQFGQWASKMIGSGVAKATGVNFARAVPYVTAGTIFGTAAGFLLAPLLGLTPGIGALIGGAVGGVIGGAVGIAVGNLPGGFWGSLTGSILGSTVGAWFDTQLNKIGASIASMFQLFSILRFFGLIAGFFTSPLTKISSLLEIVIAFVMVAGIIGTFSAFGLNSSSLNTPTQNPGSNSLNSYQSALASAFPGITQDILMQEKKEKLYFSFDEEQPQVQACFLDDIESEGYYALEKGYYNPIWKNYGILFFGEAKLIKSPIEGIVVYSGKNNIYKRDKNGDFSKSEENTLIITQLPEQTYFIAFDGIDTELKSENRIKSGQLLGTSSQNFRVSVFNYAQNYRPYNPRNATNPCEPLDEVGFPGFACNIIPSFVEKCK